MRYATEFISNVIGFWLVFAAGSNYGSGDEMFSFTVIGFAFIGGFVLSIGDWKSR